MQCIKIYHYNEYYFAKFDLVALKLQLFINLFDLIAYTAIVRIWIFVSSLLAKWSAIRMTVYDSLNTEQKFC